MGLEYKEKEFHPWQIPKYGKYKIYKIALLVPTFEK
jgi:hypothetical protein